MKIVVTSTAKNVTADVVRRCIQSTKMQGFQEFQHYYVAADVPSFLVADLWRNTDSRYHVAYSPDSVLGNLLPIWRSLDDDDIIVWLDGDDYLATHLALQDVWLEHDGGALATYGQFVYANGKLGFAAPAGSQPRKESWRATHLKTFRAGLIKRMRDSDFRGPDGEYSSLVTDQRVMLGCLELAGRERSKFIDMVLCVYDGSRWMAMSDRERAEETAEVQRIRSWEPYPRFAGSL